MKIRMLSTRLGSPDGFSIVRYEAGEEHDLYRTERERDLAAVFVREGWAVDAAAVEVPAAPVLEAAVLVPAPEDKVIVPAVRRKGKG